MAWLQTSPRKYNFETPKRLVCFERILPIAEAFTRMCSSKKLFLYFRKTNGKRPAPESFQLYQIRESATGVFL